MMTERQAKKTILSLLDASRAVAEAEAGPAEYNLRRAENDLDVALRRAWRVMTGKRMPRTDDPFGFVTDGYR